MEIESSKQKYFSELFQKDKEQNLKERISYFSRLDSDFYNRKLGFAQIIYNNYWVVIPIKGENFAFSVGMNYNFNLPEVMIISDKLTQKEFQILINEINCKIRDNAKIELDKNYYDEIIIHTDIDLDTFPEDEILPEKEKRILFKNGEKFKLVDIDKPLIFKKYDSKMEELFPCGYLRAFNYYFTDNEEINMIYSDLR